MHTRNTQRHGVGYQFLLSAAAVALKIDQGLPFDFPRPQNVMMSIKDTNVDFLSIRRTGYTHHKNRQLTRSYQHVLDEDIEIGIGEKILATTVDPTHQLSTNSRRDVLAALNAAAFIPFAQSATAADGPSTAGSFSAKEFAQRLRRVPAFAIVDATGRPFMIVTKESGIPIGYFFTTYDGARLVLDNAKRDALERKGKENVPDDWSYAKISAVPLEFAMKLMVAKTTSKDQNGSARETVYDVIPSVEDVKDAQALDGKSRIFTGRGRVPLFYIDGLDLQVGTGSDVTKRSPVYFHKSELLKEWDRQFPGKAPPEVKVMELIDTFQSAMSSVGKKDRFKDLFFVPPEESAKGVAECRKNQGSGSVYRVDEMIMVGGS